MKNLLRCVHGFDGPIIFFFVWLPFDVPLLQKSRGNALFDSDDNSMFFDGHGSVVDDGFF